MRRLRWLLLPLVSACSLPASQAPPAAVCSAPVVLVVRPDSAEVERMHRELGEDFYVVADDMMWYQAQATGVLDSLGIAWVDVRRGAARFLVRGRSRVYSWSRVRHAWFLVLYDGEHGPRIATGADVGDELRRMRWSPAPAPPRPCPLPTVLGESR